MVDKELQQPHELRSVAEAFGAEPERYDRARPRYPDELLERILSGLPGRRVLDVGTGTGILARQLQALGCDVLGVDPDPRMAEFARRSGVEVDVATFEAWDAAGRTFDALVSGQSWHWVDPIVGAARAAHVLRPSGRLAVFWNTGTPSEGLNAPFMDVYRRVLPAALVDRLTPEAIDATYASLCLRAEDGIRAAGAFGEPEQWRFEWRQVYTRDAWLDALATSGNAVPEDRLGELMEGIGAAIDVVGGSFTMGYLTVAVTALRVSS
ncbi:MAG TPA: class I SAM-dependent methyltransferase [Mycobacteriales bacterium]|nr:class I SAM-dependent methyltransferase [Mycobacteriales bacterium]